MPRGRGSKGGHKGQRRHFTNPDELEKQKEKEARERQWREQKGEVSSEESEEEEEKKSSDSSEEEEGAEEKAKGVQHLIEIENPNRVMKKPKKVAELGDGTAAEAPQLSRREREELQRQQARAHYLKLHAEGKTQQAQADLARLAIIRKQREEAAKKRDEERKAREAASKAKTEAVNKALGKKS